MCNGDSQFHTFFFWLRYVREMTVLRNDQEVMIPLSRNFDHFQFSFFFQANDDIFQDLRASMLLRTRLHMMLVRYSTHAL